MKLADYIVEFMIKCGIKHCYGYQGTMIAHLVDSIGKSTALENHVCYNEQGAAFAAVGHAKVSGNISMAYATSGPGAANLVSGIADAYYDSVPVLFITGQLNTYEYYSDVTVRQHGFQEMNVVDIVKPIVKYCKKVTLPQDIKIVLEEAYYNAITGRKGPVLIDLPMDIQRAEINPNELVGYTPKLSENTQNLTAITNMLISEINSYNRPLIVLGNGLNKTNKGKIKECIDKIGLPVVTSLLGKDILSYNNEYNMGYVGAAYGHRYANMLINKKADLIVSIGSSLCKRQTGTNVDAFAKNTKIIRIEIDTDDLSRNIHKDDVIVNYDCNQVLIDLAKHSIKIKDFSSWLDNCNFIKNKLRCFDDACKDREPNKIMSIISDFTKHYQTISCDVGQHMMWCAQSYEIVDNQRILFSGGHGAMGFALPAAIGAYFETQKPVMVIAGDGAFQMNIQELQWVEAEQIPITIFVLNNETLGLIQQQQDSMLNGNHFGSVKSQGYQAPQFSKIANAYGICAYKVNNCEDLKKTITSLNYNKPNLVEVKISRKSRAYPKTEFGQEMHNQEPLVEKELLNELLDL